MHLPWRSTEWFASVDVKQAAVHALYMLFRSGHLKSHQQIVSQRWGKQLCCSPESSLIGIVHGGICRFQQPHRAYLTTFLESNRPAAEP